MPGEYALLGHPAGPEDWKVTDVISIASLVAGIFGKGGGSEVDSALVLEQARKRFGKRAGMKVWKDFRRANDPEAPTTVRGKRFPYMPRRRRRQGGAARPAARPWPRRSSPQRAPSAETSPAATPAASCPTSARCCSRLRDAGRLERAAGLRQRSRRATRRVAVFGPQVSYFTPQILLEFEIHAPGGPSGPPLDARGTRLPRHQPLRPARPRPRLRLVGDLGRPGHRRHLRGQALRARRLEADAWPR